MLPSCLDHGFKLIFAYPKDGNESDEFTVVFPEDFLNIECCYNISRFVDKFEDVPQDSYRQMTILLADAF